ncbi:hypothetical protein [Halanaeroarchaeum sulfurireducens]|uniref:hypothetical protein n=1 Tax=Halanaeroarchaeum sulfurireducens TaxID=1604004 RepID=UPI000678D955|nr:hypothetical protein [Halanaeroarchaeum sulfurireducens]
METSRFERVGPEDADDEEAAAIAAAIGAYLTDRERAAASSESSESSWEGRQWSFAAKLGAVNRCPDRIPTSAPTNLWTASGRSERF